MGFKQHPDPSGQQFADFASRCLSKHQYRLSSLSQISLLLYLTHVLTIDLHIACRLFSLNMRLQCSHTGGFISIYFARFLSLLITYGINKDEFSLKNSSALCENGLISELHTKQNTYIFFSNHGENGLQSCSYYSLQIFLLKHCCPCFQVDKHQIRRHSQCDLNRPAISFFSKLVSLSWQG